MNNSTHGLSTRFTVQEALEVQSRQLETWKPRLSAACFAALEKRAAHENGKLRDTSTGHDVWRGSQMDDVIHNWRPTP